jgi:hypothetical protein
MNKPFLPSDRERAAVNSLTHAAIATGLAKLDRSIRASDFVRRTWDDRNADLIIKAASSPATTAITALTQISVAYLETLVPVSAGADLLQRGIGLNFAGAAQINVPAIQVPTANFVGEGLPIPVVVETTTAGPQLIPHKLAVITTLTHEMMVNPNAETLIRQALIEATGPALDKQLFSANAAASDRPAGLMNGIAALTAASAGGNKGETLVNDLQTLATAIAPVAGNGNIVLVASPDAAVALVLRLPQHVQWPVLTSSSLAARTVICVAANAIVSAVEGAPVIDASSVMEVHRESSPAEIVTSAGVVAVPVGSMYQTDQIGLRLRWPISWALRTSAGLAWMQSVNW